MNRKIIITKGLPGCGKTTWAKDYQSKNPNTIRINKDDLRAMLHNGVHSKGREKFILDVRNQLIADGLSQGHDIIIDDTNLNPIHIDSITAMVKGFAEVIVEDFTHIPVEECIKRDKKRQNYVGEAVIKQMYNKYLKPKPKIPAILPGKPHAVICDLDGTLALFGENNPYDRDFLQDEPNEPVAQILDFLPKDIVIIIVSGRFDKFQDATIAWLKMHGIRWDHIFMRSSDDTRKDVIVKDQIYRNHIEGKFNIDFVIDDRDQVVAYWRDTGLTCLQVNYGDF